MELRKDEEITEDDPLLENIPKIGITEASPNHVNADHFFTTALIMHLQNEQKPFTDQNTTSFNDSVYSQNAMNTSNHSNNLLLPSRRKNCSNRKLSESSNTSTIIVSRRIVKRCRYLGLDMCCTPKYGWIIGYGILIWLLLLVGCQQIFKGEILEKKNQDGEISVIGEPYKVVFLKCHVLGGIPVFGSKSDFLSRFWVKKRVILSHFWVKKVIVRSFQR